MSTANKHIPERTPKRWDLISTLISDTTDENKSPKIVLNEVCGTTVKLFDHSPSACKQVIQILCSKYKETFQSSESLIKDSLLSYADKSALKSIILLPPVKECCGELIIIPRFLSCTQLKAHMSQLYLMGNVVKDVAKNLVTATTNNMIKHIISTLMIVSIFTLAPKRYFLYLYLLTYLITYQSVHHPFSLVLATYYIGGLAT